MKSISYIFIVIGVVLFFAGWQILAIYFTAFRFDFINGWDTLPSASESVEESKKRGVFIYKIEVLENSIRIGNQPLFKINEAWIEKSWTSGVWYWTTKKGFHDDFNLRITTTGFADDSIVMLNLWAKNSNNLQLRCWRSSNGCFSEIEKYHLGKEMIFYPDNSDLFIKDKLVSGILKVRIKQPGT